MRSLVFLSIFISLSFTCKADETFPPLHWWGERTTFEKIEIDYNKDLKEALKLKLSLECMNWSEQDKNKIASMDSKCLLKLDKKFLDNKYIEMLSVEKLELQKEWIKFKKEYKEGDVVYNYADGAHYPRYYGIILIRNNKVINVFDFGSQKAL
jgi:hypothetical protein